jgi:phenylacetate-CoA ligase
MRPYTWSVANILFPLHERLKGHDTVTRRDELEASQWWRGEKLEAYRLEKLRWFLGHVQTHVPYYRKAFVQADFDANRLSSLADLARIPLLTKSIIRENFDALTSDAAGSLKRYNTGGSSGEPLIFLMGKDRVTHDVAAKWRATRWWDVDIGDREMVIWGSPMELGAQDVLRALRDRFLRTRLFSAFELTERSLDSFVREIRSFRPRMLFGYPSALAHIAGHAERRGERLDALGIQVVFVTSELLYPYQKETIERVFGCPVANGYGGRDAGFIAHECPDGGMHISAEDIVVEIVGTNDKPESIGIPGEIVVTHMATREFPFIRYRTGDIGVMDERPCPCGRGLPLLKEIQGRSTDFVVAADGTVMHGLALIYVLRDVLGLKQFKIIQETVARIRVLVIPDSTFRDTVVSDIIAGCRARLGGSVNVTVEKVDQIAPEASGKFRYVVSRVTDGLGRGTAKPAANPPSR